VVATGPVYKCCRLTDPTNGGNGCVIEMLTVAQEHVKSFCFVVC
jgi:hypothetical protein